MNTNKILKLVLISWVIFFCTTVYSLNKDDLLTQTIRGQVMDIYPLSNNVFDLKATVAQIVFNLDDDGRVESLTLLQGGREARGSKTKD
jgi:hypothetical protein